MDLVKAFETISEAFPDAYIECCENMWSEYWDGEIQWNSDNNILDLECGAGNTFSGEIVGSKKIHQEHTLVNLDIGTGEVITFLFINSKRVEFD